MALYSIGRRTTGTTSGNAAMDVACSTGIRPKIMEVGFFLGAATASTYGLNRTTALGTRTSPVALLAEDAGDPALTGVTLVDTALAWSVQPTFLFRRPAPHRPAGDHRHRRDLNLPARNYAGDLALAGARQSRHQWRRRLLRRGGRMIYEVTHAAGGALLDLVNARCAPIDCVAASLTAPGVVRREVGIDGAPHDGGSYAW